MRKSFDKLKNCLLNISLIIFINFGNEKKGMAY